MNPKEFVHITILYFFSEGYSNTIKVQRINYNYGELKKSRCVSNYRIVFNLNEFFGVDII